MICDFFAKQEISSLKPDFRSREGFAPLRDKSQSAMNNFSSLEKVNNQRKIFRVKIQTWTLSLNMQ